MARRLFLLGLAKGTGLALLVFVGFCLLLFLKGPACWTCRASGGTWLLKCEDCDGTGMTRQLCLSLSRTLGCGTGPSEPLRLVLRRDGIDLYSCDPDLVRWGFGGLLVAVALVAGLRSGPCLRCEGRGCRSCGGKGRLTTIDRWAT